LCRGGDLAAGRAHKIRCREREWKVGGRKRREEKEKERKKGSTVVQADIKKRTAECRAELSCDTVAVEGEESKDRVKSEGTNSDHALTERRTERGRRGDVEGK